MAEKQVSCLQAMPMLGLKGLPRTDVDRLFDAFDTNHSGEITLDELEEQLSRGVG